MSDITSDEPPQNVPQKTSAEEEIDTAIAQSRVKERKKAQQKKYMKYGATLFGVLGFAYFLYWGFKPFEGTMAYGICKVFLELNVRYPDTLRMSTVEETGLSVRIWYTQTDSFGEYRLEPIQCYFKSDETYGFILDKVTMKRRQVDPKKVENFNKILPVIFAYPPDVTLPTPLPDSLKNLQIETELFRKPIL